MLQTQKSLRLHIGFFGKTNVGKSTLVNNIVQQDVSIVSNISGTTTDTVEKTMELQPLGPVLLLDTAGIDDTSVLGNKRIEKTKLVMPRVDVAVIVSDFDGWNEYDIELAKEFKEINIPILAVINKSDVKKISQEKKEIICSFANEIVELSALADKNLTDLIIQKLIQILPEEIVSPVQIVGDILSPGSFVLMVVPIDKAAPKGRLILPQVQTIRDILDFGCASIVVRDTEVNEFLQKLSVPPSLVITDSQVFKTVSEILPTSVPLTSFSILFARYKGDLNVFKEGAKTISRLQDGDKILICESCTHHRTDDDIGRVKIPSLVKKFTGKNLIFEHFSSHEFPQNVQDYKLIIHCGGCMTNRREILSRNLKSKKQNVPITNYGITIAYCLGILDRALEPFNFCEQ